MACVITAVAPTIATPYNNNATVFCPRGCAERISQTPANDNDRNKHKPAMTVRVELFAMRCVMDVLAGVPAIASRNSFRYLQSSGQHIHDAAHRK